LSLISLTSTLMAAAPAHLTFFGDSLTDTGNFPEPANVTDPTLKNFNIYVPISNPVIITSDPMNNFLVNSEGALGKQGDIGGEARAHYSINWPLYLTYDETVGTTAPSLTTWIRYKNQAATASDNMNYAWASAVAGNPSGDPEVAGECFHSGGEAYYGDCSAITMLNDRKAYQAETAANPEFDKEHNYQAKILQIPDLNKQVSLFESDFNKQLPNNNAIFIYIGGNDISHFLKPLILDLAVESEDDFMTKRADPQMAIVASYVKQAVTTIEAAYKAQAPTDTYHIYIMSLPHLSNLHEAYSYAHIPVLGKKIISVLDKTVGAYNADLNSAVSGDSNVTYVDSGAQMDAWAASATYKDAVTKGQACSSQAAYLTASAAGTTDCQQTDSGVTTGDFSWNDAHFTAPVNEALAEYIKTQLVN